MPCIEIRPPHPPETGEPMAGESRPLPAAACSGHHIIQEGGAVTGTSPHGILPRARLYGSTSSTRLPTGKPALPWPRLQAAPLAGRVGFDALARDATRTRAAQAARPNPPGRHAGLERQCPPFDATECADAPPATAHAMAASSAATMRDRMPPFMPLSLFSSFKSTRNLRAMACPASCNGACG
eukprot:354314-Chlamydomonas_euryale.AAC.7